MLANYTGFVWLFAAYTYMILVRIFVPDPLANYLGLGGVFIFIFGLMFQSFYATLRVASLRHIDATLRPDHRRGHFYFKTAEPHDIGHGWFKTKVVLGEGTPFVHREFGKTFVVWVYHYGEWAARFKFRRAKAPSLGMVVDHGQTDYATFYEYTPDIKTGFINKGKPEPCYELIEAGGDYPHMAKMLRSVLGKKEEEKKSEVKAS